MSWLNDLGFCFWMILRMGTSVLILGTLFVSSLVGHVSVTQFD